MKAKKLTEGKQPDPSQLNPGKKPVYKEDDAPMAQKKEDEGKAMEDEDGGDDAGAAPHDDEDQDKALIQKMLKQYLGDEHADDEGAMKHAKQAYEGYKEMGYKEDEAMHQAGHALKLAKHLSMKQEKAHEGEGEMPMQQDESEGEAKQSEKKESAKLAQLMGENAKLKESLKKYEITQYLDKKLGDSKLPMAVTKLFRESLGQPKSVGEIDKAFAAFKAGYESKAGEAIFGEDLFVMTEKQSTPASKASVDFKSFLK